MPNGVVELDQEWQVGTYQWWPAEDRIAWSSELMRIYGAPHAPATKQDFLARVHPEDRQRLDSDATAAIADGSRTYDRTFRILRTDGAVRTVLDRGTIERDAAGTVSLLRGINIDITEQSDTTLATEEKLRASEARYRVLFNAIDEGMCVAEVRFDRPDGRIDYRIVEANPAFYERTGFPQTILGAWLRDAAPALEDIWYEIYGGVARTGEPTRFEQQSPALGRWFDVYAFRIDDPEDRHVAILFNNVTARKQQEEQSELLMQELSHRSKNVLGLVQVIARQTASLGAGDFLERFRMRVQALAAAQDLLVRNEERAASLSELIETQLPHFSDLIGNRIEFDGPPVTLAPEATQALGMAFHELATNASKYGALSNDDGTVTISWSTDADARFTVSWVERGGPPVTRPAGQGFGTRVTKDMIEASTGGEVKVIYAPEGISWQLSCPGDKAVI